MAYSGTLVVYGQATAWWWPPARTELGKINQMLTGHPEPADTRCCARWTLRPRPGFGHSGAVGGTFVLGVLLRGTSSPAEMFMMVVGLAASAIPEGLPAIMTVTLALGVQRMARRHAIIRACPRSRRWDR
jgi:magnesium-transporting ATPase (P-type)